MRVRLTHVESAIRVRKSHIALRQFVASVFQKFGGIRPMATAIEADFPPSTVKSWHKKRLIPRWRHRAILAACEVGNAEAAASLLDQHIRQTGVLLAAFLNTTHIGSPS